MRNIKWRSPIETAASRFFPSLLLSALLMASPNALFGAAGAERSAAPPPSGDRPAATTSPSLEPTTPSRPASESVTLKGQVVCSGCWGEADRSKVRYGTDADMKCALACWKKGIPAGLAIKKGGEFELVLLEPGALALGEKAWMPWMGKYISTTGSVVSSDGKRTMAVATIREITPAEAGFGN